MLNTDSGFKLNTFGLISRMGVQVARIGVYAHSESNLMHCLSTFDYPMFPLGSGYVSQEDSNAEITRSTQTAL